MKFIIQLLIRLFADSELAQQFIAKMATKFPTMTKILKKGKALSKKFNDVKKILNYVDPNYFLNMLKSLPQKEIQKWLSKKTKMSRAQFQEQLKILNQQKQDLKLTNQSFNEAYNTYLQGGDQTGWVKLSSSWIQRGLYTQIPGTNNGTMTIFIRSDKDKKKRIYGPYTYPMVPIEVWTAMVKAPGKNGSGAGSVMWRMWLRPWLKSYLRDNTYKKLQKTYGTLNSQTYKRLPNQNQISDLIQDQQKLIEKNTQQYYKSPFAQKAGTRGYENAPYEGAKPYTKIDGAYYATNRAIEQRNQYNQLRQPITQMEQALVRQEAITQRAREQWRRDVKFKQDLTEYMKAPGRLMRGLKREMKAVKATPDKVAKYIKNKYNKTSPTNKRSKK